MITAIDASAGVPSVDNVMVTDVTTGSFSVIWTSSEASTPNLSVYDDVIGTVPTQGIALELQPVANGSSDIATRAEDNGVLKVRVTGLLPDTTYYFQTATASKSTGDITYYPNSAPMLSVTTEVRATRTIIVSQDEVPFSNDLLVYDCYLLDNITPAEGTLLVADVEGDH